MITDQSSLSHYLASDLKAYGLSRWTVFSGFKHPVLAWQRQLRHIEYRVNTRQNLFGRVVTLIAKYRFQRESIRLGFSIPPNVFGPGLTIAHWGTIVINGRARVGANCRVHPGTCLGANLGSDENRAPTIGDDAYLGPGAKVFGGVVLGSNVTIGANAVVNRNFDSDAVLVGVPARDVAVRQQGVVG